MVQACFPTFGHSQLNLNHLKPDYAKSPERIGVRFFCTTLYMSPIQFCFLKRFLEERPPENPALIIDDHGRKVFRWKKKTKVNTHVQGGEGGGGQRNSCNMIFRLRFNSWSEKTVQTETVIKTLGKSSG